jgi:GT2 family glycosyltransferase
VVSIINFRTRDLTLACIRSALDDIARLDGATAEVVVVDNRSDDGSAQAIEDWIAAQSPPVPVRLIRSPVNSGFSGGHNQAIAAQRAAFYLLMNSDGLLRPGALGTLLAAARATPAAGLFAPRIEHEDGEVQTSCFGFPNPASELIRAAATAPVTRLLSRFDVPLPLPPAPDRIGWASFACILLSGKMIDALGPLDEGYFLYFEDVEFCLRARRAGWKLLHVPEARMVHFRGGSGPVKKLAGAHRRLPGYYYASRSRFFYQAGGRAGLLAANLCWILGRGIAALRPLTGRERVPAVAGEWRDIWINFLKPLGDSRAPREG